MMGLEISILWNKTKQLYMSGKIYVWSEGKKERDHENGV